MRVVTWNVWWRFGGRWPEREPRIAAALARHSPDLVALQETWGTAGGSQPRALADRLGLRGSVFVPTSLPPVPPEPETPDQAGVTMGIGLMSRWPLRSVEVYDLPHDLRTGPAPTAVLATVDHPAGPLHTFVTCLEWQPQYAPDQLAQARVLARLAADPRLDGPLPVLVMGDLNAYPGQPEIAPLSETLVDLWAAAGGSPDAVTLDPAHPQAPVEATHLIGRRIDHILARPGDPARPLRPTRAFLIGDRPDEGLYASDHWAPAVDLTESDS
ncbi:endonuclease/exonuclease/phosphatase family protein [Nucisporomicrobium flavum]|uniref:endonuclease/exonuclease/phosphatase family protein n=1 Tax=Nucisporomicrobium flavum TaxID=2785915 RepID=UPI0018F76D69|nr:endonuclease/exonuclease/phosphatase family protein [Nucisporomicrobium flavum]